MGHLFETDPLVITALHLPDLGGALPARSMAWLEDYVLRNLATFAEGGVPAVMLQDETLNASTARPDTVAMMASLTRLAHYEFPQIKLGIIIQAHDPIAALAVAHSGGAEFVRIKVFVGAMVKAEGIQTGCGVAARDFRQRLGREDLAILADVHDRTGVPLVDVRIDKAARWAVQTGANGLILTGADHAESLHYLRTVRQSGVTCPLLLGGGATERNIAEVLTLADGVIVSHSLKRPNTSEQDILQWDSEKIKRFMEVARSASGRNREKLPG